jgi:hypothetical protein
MRKFIFNGTIISAIFGAVHVLHASRAADLRQDDETRRGSEAGHGSDARRRSSEAGLASRRRRPQGSAEGDPADHSPGH